MRRVLALALLCLTLPARAGLFDDGEARRRIEQLRTEVTELTQRAETVNRNQLDFANQTEALRADIARLRGQLEVISYELEATQKRQKDFYVDLDNRLRTLEQPVTETKSAEAPKADPAAETRNYEMALGQIKTGKFKEAGTSFLAFIKTWPESTLLPSAHYWGAYAHAQARQHARAAELFAHFAATWPTDERAPSALEGQVASLEALKDKKGARAALQLLADKYPATDAGKRAKARLKKKQ